MTRFTTKDDLEFLKRNKDKFIKKMGKEEYEKLIKELEEKLK